MNDADQAQRPAAVPRSGVTGWLIEQRGRVRSLPGGTVAWRVGITVVGALVIGVGLLLLPLPGPGWLIIFAGLGLLATEYPWAARLLGRARRLSVGIKHWTGRQHVVVRIAVGLLGLLVLVAALVGSWYLYTFV